VAKLKINCLGGRGGWGVELPYGDSRKEKENEEKKLKITEVGEQSEESKVNRGGFFHEKEERGGETLVL